jgi:hypothetical protein
VEIKEYDAKAQKKLLSKFQVTNRQLVKDEIGDLLAIATVFGTDGELLLSAVECIRVYQNVSRLSHN